MYPSRRCAPAGRQLLRELGEALRMLNHERSTRCVVVRSSTPGVFCAGADLKARFWLLAVLARSAWSLYAGDMIPRHHAQERPLPIRLTVVAPTPVSLYGWNVWEHGVSTGMCSAKAWT